LYYLGTDRKSEELMMKSRGFWLSIFVLCTSLVCLHAFGVGSVVGADTVPQKADERFNSQEIKSVRVYVVVDPDSKGYEWKKKHGAVFNKALSDHLIQKGYKVESIDNMSYIKARSILGSTRRFPFEDENYSQWLATLDLQKDLSAVMVTYIQFHHYYGGAKVEWLSEISIEYCLISAASGMKLLCSDHQTFMNTEKNEGSYGGTASVIYRGRNKRPVRLNPKTHTHSFIKESVDKVFENLPNTE
jgi:hypothetical protein